MKTVAAALIILVCFPALTHAKSADAVVKIYATKGVRTSLGSGFFIRKDGLLLTAYHVVEGANDIEIFDHQKRRYDDVLVKSISPKYDIAVLHVQDARHLSHF
jgi:S1-C subfamily serine protease